MNFPLIMRWLFLGIPSILILQLHPGEQGGHSQSQPGFAGRAGGSDTAQRSRCCSDLPSQGCSDSAPKLEVVKSILCLLTDCKIIPCKPDPGVDEIPTPYSRFNTDSKDAALCMCVCVLILQFLVI